MSLQHFAMALISFKVCFEELQMRRFYASLVINIK